MARGASPKPPAEYTRSLKGLGIKPLGSPDPYAPGAGFVERLAGGLLTQGRLGKPRPLLRQQACRRDLSPDTGTGGELYAVIGHGQRQLDRVIAVVGRVVEGIDKLSSLPRGTEALGFYKDKAQFVPIASIRLASDIPAAERPAYEYMDSGSASFAEYLRVRANRKDDSTSARGRSRPVQRHRAGEEEGLGVRPPRPGRPRFLCWMTTKPLCERMPASASGRAVAQKAHSAETRPMIQWVRPQPGQWLTSCSR